MKTVSLNGSLRNETGKKMAKRIRKAELVPAIIYGGEENVLISVNEKELKALIYTPHVHIIEITVDGKKYPTIVKDIQFHPVTDRIIHVDFYQVSDKKKVTVSLPVILTGQAEGAKQGGKLQLVNRKLRACGFPQDLPDEITIDITHLTLGKSVMVGDVKHDKFDLVDAPSTVIATVKLTRAARGAQSEEAAASAAPAAQ